MSLFEGEEGNFRLVSLESQETLTILTRENHLHPATSGTEFLRRRGTIGEVGRSQKGCVEKEKTTNRSSVIHSA